MKKIVILTNKDGRKKVMGKNDYDITVNKQFEDIHVIVLPDNYDLDDIKEACGKETSPDFLAYHNNGNKEFLSDHYFTQKKNFQKKGFSHYVGCSFPDDFYNVILPKVYETEDLLLKDIEQYFQSEISLGSDFAHTLHIWGNEDMIMDTKYNKLTKFKNFVKLKENHKEIISKTTYESNDFEDTKAFIDDILKNNQ